MRSPPPPVMHENARNDATKTKPLSATKPNSVEVRNWHLALLLAVKMLFACNHAHPEKEEDPWRVLAGSLETAWHFATGDGEGKLAVQTLRGRLTETFRWEAWRGSQACNCRSM